LYIRGIKANNQPYGKGKTIASQALKVLKRKPLCFYFSNLVML